MVEKVRKFIEARGLLSEGARVLVGVSGGADSVALLYVLRELGFECVAGHVNHNLRGAASDGDERFVAELGARLGVEVMVRSVDVRGYAATGKVSIETAARELRIGSLAEMAMERRCAAVATAHHGDDDVETVVHRILRGTGFRGLAGIRAENELAGVRFVRPMLIVGRDEVESFLDERGIRWRVDHTNAEVDFTRNWVRHLLLPYLEEEYGGGIREKLRWLAFSCGRLQRRVEAAADEWFGKLAEEKDGKIVIELAGFNGCDVLVKGELVRMAVERLGVGERGMDFGKYSQIGEVAAKGHGSVNLPRDFKAEVGGGRFVIGPAVRQVREAVELEVGGVVEYDGSEIETKVLDAGECDLEKFLAEKDKDVEWFDADGIVGQLRVRGAVDGDKFLAMGRGSQRKIGDYMKDKAGAVVADDERVLWIVGARRSGWAVVDEKTERVLELRVVEN